jgi:rare lipoprotein A
MRLGEPPAGASARFCVRAPASSLAAVAVGVLLAGCSGSERLGTIDPRYGTSSSPRVIALGEPVPKGGGVYRVGAPYTVAGRTYVPAEDPHYRAEGMASWYGQDFHGRLTANGEIYDMDGMSAAHATLPMPSYVRVTNLSNSKSVILRVNDRGPYNSDRIIDVSSRAAALLGFYGSGLAPVRVEYVGLAPLEGSNDRELIATLRQGEPAPAPAPVRIASNKPFVPQMTSRVALRDVPLPPERPYSLGEAQAEMRPSLSAAASSAGAVVAYVQPRADAQRNDLYAPPPLRLRDSN